MVWVRFSVMIQGYDGGGMFRSAELQFLRGSSVVATFLVSVPSISVFGMEKALVHIPGF